MGGWDTISLLFSGLVGLGDFSLSHWGADNDGGGVGGFAFSFFSFLSFLSIYLSLSLSISFAPGTPESWCFTFAVGWWMSFFFFCLFVCLECSSGTSDV